MIAKKQQRMHIFLSWLVLLSLLLVACGPDETPAAPAAAEQPSSSESQAPAQPAAEATQPPAAEAQPTAADAAAQPTQAAAQPAAGAAGDVDTGFRPADNGFSYQNYGDVGVTPANEPFQVVNLSSVEMRRLFGDGVCAAAPASDETCALTPPAEKWMEQNNAGMKGGHCEGFAVLSQMFYGGVLDPTKFGAAKVAELQIKDNAALQRELAYWWTTQGPTWGKQQVLDPKGVIQYLSSEYAKDPKNLYRLGIMKMDKTGGHAITAYGVQDKGNGTYWVMVYDNNYPGQERKMVIDTNANTWEYEAAINPSVQPDLYKGNAENPVFVAANQPRLEKFPCDFCNQPAASTGGRQLASLAQDYNEIWTEGYVNVLLEDEKGRKVGTDAKGNFVNDLKEAKVQPVLAGPLTEVPPMIELPSGMAFTANIYGDSKAKEEPASVIMIGRGYYIGLDNITMETGQADKLAFDGEGDFITYTTDSKETPEIVVGVEKTDADFELVLKAVEVSKGTDIHVLFDKKEDVFAFQTTSDAVGKFMISITRIDKDGKEETFDTGDTPIEIETGKLMYFYFGKWKGQGSNLEVGYDENGNGTIEDTETSNMKDAQ